MAGRRRNGRPPPLGHGAGLPDVDTRRTDEDSLMSALERKLWSMGVAFSCVLSCGHDARPRDMPDGQSGASPAPTVREVTPPSQLVVLRPAAGDVWTEGRSYTIRWRAVGIARVNVGLALGGKDKGHAALDLPGSSDSLRWRVPAGFVSGFGLRRSTDARVRVEDARDPMRFAESPSFTVVAPRNDTAHR